MTDFESLLLYLACFSLSTAFMYQWRKQNSGLFLFLGLLPPILLAAMRYGVGTDFFNYLGIFYGLRNRSLAEIFQSVDNEGGFGLLMKIASGLGGIEWFYGLSALCVLLPAALAFKRDYADYPMGLMWFFFLLSTYMVSFNIMRQSIAVAIVLYAARYLFQNNLKRFLITVCIAGLFHFSAIVFAPCYLLRQTRTFMNRRQLLAFAVLLLLIVNMSAFFGMETDVEGINKYTNYLHQEEGANNREFFLNLLFCSVFLLNRKRMAQVDDRANLYLFFALLAVAIGITGFVTPFVKRVALYFSVFNIPLGCMLIKSARGSRQTFMRVFVLTYYVGRFIVVSYFIGQGNVFPYNTESTFRQHHRLSCYPSVVRPMATTFKECPTDVPPEYLG
jgi:hypothetical protein